MAIASITALLRALFSSWWTPLKAHDANYAAAQFGAMKVVYREETIECVGFDPSTRWIET